jgi:hypothetical protein
MPICHPNTSISSAWRLYAWPNRARSYEKENIIEQHYSNLTATEVSSPWRMDAAPERHVGDPLRRIDAAQAGHYPPVPVRRIRRISNEVGVNSLCRSASSQADSGAALTMTAALAAAAGAFKGSP